MPALKLTLHVPAFDCLILAVSFVSLHLYWTPAAGPTFGVCTVCLLHSYIDGSHNMYPILSILCSVLSLLLKSVISTMSEPVNRVTLIRIIGSVCAANPGNIGVLPTCVILNWDPYPTITTVISGDGKAA